MQSCREGVQAHIDSFGFDRGMHVPKSGETVEFENDRVKVLRVTIDRHEKHPVRTRLDRVLVWLTDAHEWRSEPGGTREEIHRNAGEVAWRAASQHQIENLDDNNVELLIVELKK